MAQSPHPTPDWLPWRVRFTGGPLNGLWREVDLLGSEYVEERPDRYLIYDYMLVKTNGTVEARFREEVMRDA